MARQPTTQFGPEITQTSDLRSSVTPQQGVAQQPVLLEGIGRLFDQASSAFESAREAKSQASVADFVKRQTMVADALAQGQISSSAHARTIMRKNFLEALDANPTLWKDLAGAHASIIGTPGLGEVAAAGTEEEQAKMARRDALVSAGQLSYDADDQTFERVDSNVRLAQEAERQHTMRMQTLDEELKQGQVTAQRKKEIEEERAQANVDFFRQAAPVEMNSVRTEFETILNSNMSEADKLVALDDYWVNWNNKLSDKFGSASEREGSAFRKPFEDLFESYKLRVTGELNDAQLDRNNKRIIATQKAIALDDPAIARLAVTSDLFGSDGLTQIITRGGNQDVFNAYTKYLAGGDPENGRNHPTLITDMPDETQASDAYLKDVSRGVVSDDKRTQEEASRRFEAAMQSVVDDGNRLRRDPKKGRSLVRFMSSPEFLAARKARPDLVDESLDELRDTLERNYDDEVWGMVNREFRSGSVHFFPERIGARGTEEVPTPEGIEVAFRNGSVKFLPTNPNNSTWKMEADRLNRQLAPVINTTIKAGAHLEGHTNYDQVWEQASTAIFGEEALAGGDVEDDLSLQDFTFPTISTTSIPDHVAKDEEFMTEVSNVANKYQFAPADLMAVMDFETGVPLTQPSGMLLVLAQLA